MSPLDEQRLIDRIYETAFVPEYWVPTLDRIAQSSGSSSGGLLLLQQSAPPRFRSSELTRDTLQAFCAGNEWLESDRAPRQITIVGLGFQCDADLLTPEQLDNDPVTRRLRPLGLGWQIGTQVPMPTGELAIFAFERWLRDGRHTPAQMALLNRLHPHLARAGMIAARLGLERARTMVDTLGAIGMPAAVVDAAHKVIAVNPLLEAIGDTFLPLAFGGIALRDASANALFQTALDTMPQQAPHVRSIPLAATATHPATVVHVLPLRGMARDAFSGATAIVIATRVRPDARDAPGINVPLLRGLFDLTPQEGRLAAALGSTLTLQDAANECGIGVDTARQYLKQVFAKTGTHRQAELVALLRDTRPLRTI